MTMTEMNVEAVREMLAPLWRKNRPHVLERLAHVRQALLNAEEPSAEVRLDLHALIGTLGTYGYPDGSVLLDTIHASLIGDTDDDRVGLVGQLDELTATLTEE